METFSQREPIPLQPRFAEIKKKIVSSNDDAIAASWNRLLRELKREIEVMTTSSPEELIPSIDFEDIVNPSSRGCRQDFSQKLRRRGVAVIRGVVPRATALAWRQDVEEYIFANSQTHTTSSSSHVTRHATYDLFWCPAQIQARAHPNVLTAQKFAMSHWRVPSQHIPRPAPVTAPFVSVTSPVTYADRLLVQRCDSTLYHKTRTSSTAQVDNGGVERWEIDGYGRAGTYNYIFEGWWEGHDPWDASARIPASPDLYGGAGRCSVLRMFQGLLSLGGSEDLDPDLSDAYAGADNWTHMAGLAVVPLLKHAISYFLLRPFFSPQMDLLDDSTMVTTDMFLSEANWTLTRPDEQDSILHGALPSYEQEINNLLHPHLQLDQSLVPIPALNPGDYIIWHPDLIHASTPGSDGAMMLCLPACPLTQTNALYLARQRKAFLLGQPGPDFAGGGSGRDESHYVGRPGWQEVNEAGGEDGLRAMGLYPWGEEDAKTEGERQVLSMANEILFPDRFGM